MSLSKIILLIFLKKVSFSISISLIFLKRALFLISISQEIQIKSSSSLCLISYLIQIFNIVKIFLKRILSQKSSSKSFISILVLSQFSLNSIMRMRRMSEFHHHLKLQLLHICHSCFRNLSESSRNSIFLTAENQKRKNQNHKQKIQNQFC